MREPRGILMVGNFLSGHGKIPGVCEELATRLSQCGWRVMSTSTRLNPALRGLDMAATVLRRVREYDVAQIDIFSGRAFIWAELVTSMLRAMRKPHVLSLHGGGLPDLAERRPSRVARVLQGASAVTAPSAHLAEAMGSIRSDIQVVPNPFDIDRYRFRERGPLNPNIVWLRSFHRIYNPTMAVRALALAADRIPAARMTMIGPDKGDGAKADAVKAADSLGVANLIEFADRIEKAEVADTLDRNDVFLNTSDIDNAPMSVIEALACGCCVVSTDVGGLPRLVSHMENGWLVAKNDAGAMAAAIVHLVGDQSLSGSISKAARRTAEALDWEQVRGSWLRILTSAVERA